MSVSITGQAEWLQEPGLQGLLRILNSQGEEARIAGGAVRNALFGIKVKDVDIATTALPEEVIRRAGAAGYRTVPTGIEHGTVTVIAQGEPYEVTTLREDVETDGRRARVRFGRSWEADARRRDFTINGLYAEADGTVVDLVGGVEDLRNRRLRFIGDPDKRIREDYLRILRFFRLFALYGEGRPDAEGLKACTRLRAGLAGLSAERIWSEMKLLLSAPDPSRALLWMRQTGVLAEILPQTERWGIDRLLELVAAESVSGWEPDALLRLQAILPPRTEEVSDLARRLKMSRRETERMVKWAGTAPLNPELTEQQLRLRLYREGAPAIRDRLRLDLAHAIAQNDSSEIGYRRLLAVLEGWRRPEFPLSGKDLSALGIDPGIRMGQMLKQLEEEWAASGFTLSRADLLDRARGLQKHPC